MSSPVPWAVAFALVGVAIAIVTHRPDDAPPLTLPSEAVAKRETSPAALAAITPAVSRATDLPQPPNASALDQLQRFIDARGISFGPQAQGVVVKFGAEARDQAWAPTMEAQIVAELARSTLAIADWYVECRRSRCAVILVTGTIGQRRQQELPNRMVTTEQQRLGAALNLLGLRGYRLGSEYDALATLLDFHRRCASEWNCLERAD